MLKQYPLPQIDPWPNHREAPTEVELAEIHSYTELSEEDQSLQQKKVAEYLGSLDLVSTPREGKSPSERLDLAVISDRVVDLYFKAYNKKGCDHAHDYELSALVVDEYAQTLLGELETRHQQGNQQAKDDAERITRRLIKGERVANGYMAANLANVGLGAILRDSDIALYQTRFQVEKADFSMSETAWVAYRDQKGPDHKDVKEAYNAMATKHRRAEGMRHAVALYGIKSDSENWQLPQLESPSRN